MLLENQFPSCAKRQKSPDKWASYCTLISSAEIYESVAHFSLSLAKVVVKFHCRKLKASSFPTHRRATCIYIHGCEKYMCLHAHIKRWKIRKVWKCQAAQILAPLPEPRGAFSLQCHCCCCRGAVVYFMTSLSEKFPCSLFAPRHSNEVKIFYSSSGRGHIFILSPLVSLRELLYALVDVHTFHNCKTFQPQLNPTIPLVFSAALFMILFTLHSFSL